MKKQRQHTYGKAGFGRAVRPLVEDGCYATTGKFDGSIVRVQEANQQILAGSLGLQSYGSRKLWLLVFAHTSTSSHGPEEGFTNSHGLGIAVLDMARLMSTKHSHSGLQQLPEVL